MAEYEPLDDGERKLEPTVVPLKGPNVISTLDSEPHPDAVKAQDASIRRHLKDRRPRHESDSPDAA